jgi:peroxin-6
MLKAITRQAGRVDEKIRLLSEEQGESLSTAHFFDSVATPEDVLVVVGEDDFVEAKRELVGSVRFGFGSFVLCIVLRLTGRLVPRN